MATVNHISFLLLLCSSLILASIPFPELTGPRHVGTTRIELIDTSRADPFAPVSQPRIIPIQFWYPIDNSSSPPLAPWVPPNSAAYLDEIGGEPPGTLESIITNTFLNGTAIFPLCHDGKLPVVVFSPGSGSPASFYTAFTSNLASHGYIIVGVDHIYDSDPVELSNGTLVHGILSDANNTQSAIVRGQDVTWLATQLTLPNLLNWLNVDADTRSDLQSSIKELRLGIFGHSIGGTAAALAKQFPNSSYVSSASLDGPFYGPLLTDGFYSPFFYMAAQDSGNHLSLVKEWGLIQGWKEAVAVNGTEHMSFTDAVVLVKLVPPDLGIAVYYGGSVGTVEAGRMVGLVTMYMRKYFHWTLLGGYESEILEGPVGEWPEVSFEDL